MMGCDHYTVAGWNDEAQGWKEGVIKFDDLGHGDVPCLCGFSSMPECKLDPDTVRALAYLGAAVALQHQQHSEYRILPYDVPKWLREDIDRCILGRSSGDNQ